MSEFRLSASPAFRLAVLLIAGIVLERWLLAPLSLIVPLLLVSTVVAALGIPHPRPFLGKAAPVAGLMLCMVLGAAK